MAASCGHLRQWHLPPEEILDHVPAELLLKPHLNAGVGKIPPIAMLGEITLTVVLARPVLRSYPLHSSAEEALVPRPLRCALRLRSRLLLLPQGASPWCPHLRNRGSIDCIPCHQDHRPTSTAAGSRGLQKEGCEMGQQA